MATEKTGARRSAAQLGKIFRLPIQDSPSDACRDGCLRHLDHFGAHRLYEDRIGALGFVVDNPEQLLGLIDGVIFGMHNLKFRADAGRCLSG